MAGLNSFKHKKKLQISDLNCLIRILVYIEKRLNESKGNETLVEPLGKKPLCGLS